MSVAASWVEDGTVVWASVRECHPSWVLWG